MLIFIKRILFPVLAVALGNVQALEMVDLQNLNRQAEQAYADGDRNRARSLYDEVLKSNPDDSRATYRLASLQPAGSSEALRLFRDYVRLEPQDPWGHMALGDALAASGDVDQARTAYSQAFRIVPRETDAFVGLGRILSKAGRSDEAIDVYQRWALAQPGNPSAWLELGKAQQSSRRYSEASVTLATAYNLKPSPELERLLRRSLYQTAPAIQPLLGRSRDSDDVETVRRGVIGDWQLSDRSRLGFRLQHSDVSDPFDEGEADEFGLSYKGQPRPNVRIDGGIGIAWLKPSVVNAEEQSVTTYNLRIRLDSPQAGPAGELRLDHFPLLYSPGVLQNPVEVSEVRGMFEVPIRGATRARFRLRKGTLESSVDRNTRTGYDGGLVYRLHPTVELIANYSQLGYDQDSNAGYSAPEKTQTIEFGTYAEFYDYWPLTIVVDAAIGTQRRDDHGEPAGGWGDSIRFWGQLSWDLRPGLRLDLELEASNSQDPATGAAASTEWSYSAMMLSLRFAFNVKDARNFALSKR